MKGGAFMKTGKKTIILLVIALVLPSMAWAGPKVIKYAHFQPAKLDQPKQAAALAFKNYVESSRKHKGLLCMSLGFQNR